MPNRLSFNIFICCFCEEHVLWHQNLACVNAADFSSALWNLCEVAEVRAPLH